MSTVSDLLKQARARLAELEPLVEEHRRLTEVVETLEASSDDRARRPAPRRRGAAHAKGIGRSEEALRYIAEHPGAKVSEIAGAMGIGSTYLYRLLPKLEREGQLRKKGTGYFLRS